MAKTRSYKLICPIARALDRIGDRWTLLILRDLHAGPARFSELQRGLTGIAANLLTERLGKLVDDGLVAKVDGGHGTSVYDLTALGAQTGDLIFELAMFGARFEPEATPVTPGNLRSVATTLGIAARRVVKPDMDFRAAVQVDGEAMQLAVHGGRVEMRYAPCPTPDVVFSTSYGDLLAVTEGGIPLEDFVRDHCHLDAITPGKDAEFARLLSDVVVLLRD